MSTQPPPPLPAAPEALRAAFNPLIKPYLVLVGTGILCVTVVGIPLALLWAVLVGPWWARHYFERLECVLDARTLRYRKGILFQVEKTIPLENIQDVTFIEGPLLKRFNLAVLKFETAGQSQGQAHDMRLMGIIEAHAFRDRILAARQRLRDAHLAAPTASSPDAAAVLERLDTIIALLRAQKPN
jgi:putative membrane protein